MRNLLCVECFFLLLLFCILLPFNRMTTNFSLSVDTINEQKKKDLNFYLFNTNFNGHSIYVNRSTFNEFIHIIRKVIKYIFVKL